MIFLIPLVPNNIIVLQKIQLQPVEVRGGGNLYQRHSFDFWFFRMYLLLFIQRLGHIELKKESATRIRQSLKGSRTVGAKRAIFEEEKKGHKVLP